MQSVLANHSSESPSAYAHDLAWRLLTKSAV
jgi:hypothetical protein